MSVSLVQLHNYWVGQGGHESWVLNTMGCWKTKVGVPEQMQMCVQDLWGGSRGAYSCVELELELGAEGNGCSPVLLN